MNLEINTATKVPDLTALQAITAVNPSQEQIANAEDILYSLAEGIKPEMLLLIFDKRAEKSACLSLPRPLFKKNGTLVSAIEPQTFSNPLLTEIQTSVKTSLENISGKDGYVQGVVGICFNNNLGINGRKPLQVGVLTTKSANNLNPFLIANIQTIQARLNTN